jgi:hypothetical protein
MVRALLPGVPPSVRRCMSSQKSISASGDREPGTRPDDAQLWKHHELLGQAEGVAVGLGAPEVTLRRRGPLWKPALSFGAGDSLVSVAARRRVAAAAVLGIVLLDLGPGG